MSLFGLVTLGEQQQSHRGIPVPTRDKVADGLYGVVPARECAGAAGVRATESEMPQLSTDGSSPGADRKVPGKTGQRAREHVNVDDLARNPRSER
ncbi:hypothetical protein GCM10010469_03050 [Streptomyces labedae]|uniref:Uncharacterized protein n=1 Tax=Streptomyces labedae TaxID=285569 RepID=A0ABP6QNX7_9ACTN